MKFMRHTTSTIVRSIARLEIDAKLVLCWNDVAEGLSLPHRDVNITNSQMWISRHPTWWIDCASAKGERKWEASSNIAVSLLISSFFHFDRPAHVGTSEVSEYGRRSQSKSTHTEFKVTATVFVFAGQNKLSEIRQGNNFCLALRTWNHTNTPLPIAPVILFSNFIDVSLRI